MNWYQFKTVSLLFLSGGLVAGWSGGLVVWWLLRLKIMLTQLSTKLQLKLKLSLATMYQVKKYDQNKIVCQILGIFFVFRSHLWPKIALILRWLRSSQFLKTPKRFCCIIGPLKGKKVQKIINRSNLNLKSLTNSIKK